jgi:hypothetical protein
LIAIDRPRLPAFEEVAAWFEEHFPDASQPVLAASTERLLTFTIGDFTAAAAMVDRPIPWSQLEGPCATAWYWADASEVMRDHRAHLLVALVDEGGKPIEKAMTLTQFTAALTGAAPSLGVFWGPGRMVHAAEAFCDQAVQMAADDLPLFLWVDFRIETIDEAGAVQLYTTGLEALGQSELETPRYAGPAQELLDHAYNFAHYLLEQRKVVRDGDTVGLADHVQVTARRAPSMLGGDLEVLRIEFEQSAE